MIEIVFVDRQFGSDISLTMEFCVDCHFVGAW